MLRVRVMLLMMLTMAVVLIVRMAAFEKQNSAN